VGKAITPHVFGLHLCICIASHEHIHLIITCASSYVSMLQHDVSLVLMHMSIICDVPMLYLVPRGVLHVPCTMFQVLHGCVSVFQLIVSLVSVECFVCFIICFS
jgi:hypothetical protein